MMGLDRQDEDGEMSHIDMLIQAGTLFAKIVEVDPALLVTVLDMGRAIAKTALDAQANMVPVGPKMPVPLDQVQSLTLNPPSPMMGGAPQMQPSGLMPPGMSPVQPPAAPSIVA